jgi:hypothetical protein
MTFSMPPRHAMMATQEEIRAVLREPPVDLRVPIARYVESYVAAFGCMPWGLHYVTGLGTLWIPPPSSDAEELSGDDVD